MTINTDHINAVAQASFEAFRQLRGFTPAAVADAITAVADGLDSSADQLIPIAEAETGLTEPRLKGELLRTTVQLCMFADVVRAGDYLDVRIDESDPDFVLGPRPDLRRMLRPVGPVLNFAASNFPFAFSVAGGDTAAALAARCSVIVKAHHGHPELSRRTAAIVQTALTNAGLPEALFQLVEGQEEGLALLKHPLIRAGSFTGSTKAGRFLADIAAARPAPIPFYGELGSTNPVFVTRRASQERTEEIANGFVASVSGSAGQLCTKPGFLFTPETPELDQRIAALASAVPTHRLLNAQIAKGYADRRDIVLATAGVSLVAEGSLRIDGQGQGWATPTIVKVSLDDLRAGYRSLEEECFGPLSIIVTVPDGTDLKTLVPDFFEGSLTGSMHIAPGEVSTEIDELIGELAEHCGRVIVNGWPTGVAVASAQQHGGPWPSTTSDATSVGTASVGRFLRGVAFQSTPETYLPAPLQGENAWDSTQPVTPSATRI